jgi:thymidylate synthase ThyX
MDSCHHPWVLEQWDDAEREILQRYFTSADLPVFALRGLSPTVCGALFARYSRTSKSLRRLFLDEFAAGLATQDEPGQEQQQVGERQAHGLYERVLGEFGDDSVAQLGGAHLACEQVSNLLTKVLERPRLGSYLEQSTRYIDFSSRRPDGSFRYWRDTDPARADHPDQVAYRAHMDQTFADYIWLLDRARAWFAPQVPGQPDDPARLRTVRAKALDAVRGVLPAATLSNLGIHASGQTFEGLLLRARASQLAEARDWAGIALEQLRQVIPAFLQRVDVADRGGIWSAYFEACRTETARAVAQLGGAGASTPEIPADAPASVTLVEWDPRAETKLVANIAYPYSHLSDLELEQWAYSLSPQQRQQIIETSAGDRTNRRHRPGRGWERPAYRFDIVSDYGAFRDLQRHRILEIEWQSLSPVHGFGVPPALQQAGPEVAGRYREAMERSGALYQRLLEGPFPAQAPYAVALGYRIRYHLGLNAREAMHILELRSQPAGHPSYRWIAQQMHNLIYHQAGHHAIANTMRFVDHSSGEQGRLAAELRQQQRAAST